MHTNNIIMDRIYINGDVAVRVSAIIGVDIDEERPTVVRIITAYPEAIELKCASHERAEELWKEILEEMKK